MDIALCLSGQPRISNDVINNNKIMIDNKNVETFIHCWWNHDHKSKTIMFHSEEKFINDDLGNLFINVYNAKDSIIDDYKDFDLSFCKNHNYETWNNVPQKHFDIFTPALLYGFLSQAFSIRKSIELALGTSKQVVVRSRPDIVYVKDTFSEIDRLIMRDDEIYFQSSMEGGHVYSGEFPNNPCDWFFCGTPKAMDNYTKSFQKSINVFCENGVRHVRDLARFNAQNANLKIVLCDFGAIMHRQLIKNENHRNVQKYYDEFNSDILEITNNHDSWPLFHDKIDFKFLKSR